MNERGRLPEGLYDAPITAELDHALRVLEKSLVEEEPLDPNDSPRALARLVHQRVIHALASFPTSPNQGKARPARRDVHRVRRGRCGHVVRAVDVDDLLHANETRACIELAIALGCVRARPELVDTWDEVARTLRKLMR
jgi:hypothetical protein